MARSTMPPVKKRGEIVAVALDHLAIGLALLCTKASNVLGAILHLNEAVEDLRRSGHQDYMPYGLLARARLRFLQGDAKGAQADLNEAWEIAERGPMRLHMADIHLYRARLFFREKPYPWDSPAADLTAAEKLINECGYHRRDEELADAKRAILGA